MMPLRPLTPASGGLTEDLLQSAGCPNCAPDTRRIPEVAGPLRLPGFNVCTGESGSSDPRSTMTHVFPPRTDTRMPLTILLPSPCPCLFPTSPEPRPFLGVGRLLWKLGQDVTRLSPHRVAGSVHGGSQARAHARPRVFPQSAHGRFVIQHKGGRHFCCVLEKGCHACVAPREMELSCYLPKKKKNLWKRKKFKKKESPPHKN